MFSFFFVNQDYGRRKDLSKLLKTKKPKHNVGDFFCSAKDTASISPGVAVLFYKEDESATIILS